MSKNEDNKLKLFKTQQEIQVAFDFMLKHFKDCSNLSGTGTLGIIFGLMNRPDGKIDVFKQTILKISTDPKINQIIANYLIELANEISNPNK